MLKNQVDERRTKARTINSIINKENFGNFNIEGKLFFNLNLLFFKTKKCSKNNCKNQNSCNYFHNKNDQRRNPYMVNYNIKLCPKGKKCTQLEKCSFAHNKIEILYHPFFFKKKYCIKYYTNQKCNYGKFCSFAHSDEELRINVLHKYNFDSDFFLFHYKTEFCPLGNIDHDKNLCVYAHNFQDYKRKKINNIIPIKCRNWNLNISYSNYIDGCKFGSDCKFGHGWKELCYNPLIYKTKECSKNNNDCKYKSSCHYFHNKEEENIFKKEENSILLIVPKNKHAINFPENLSFNKLKTGIIKAQNKNLNVKKNKVNFIF